MYHIHTGLRKSKLQRFLDVFEFHKIAQFLTIVDVCNLSYTSFYFHARIYDQTECRCTCIHMYTYIYVHTYTFIIHRLTYVCILIVLFPHGCSYQVSSTHICNMYRFDCCGFTENNYLRLSNTNMKGGEHDVHEH